MTTSLDGKAGESKNCSCVGFLCSSLPDDILVEILYRITDRKHLIRLKSVCKYWNNLITDVCVPKISDSSPFRGFIYHALRVSSLEKYIDYIPWFPWLLQWFAFVCWGFYSAVLCVQSCDKTVWRFPEILRSKTYVLHPWHLILSNHLTTEYLLGWSVVPSNCLKTDWLKTTFMFWS